MLSYTHTLPSEVVEKIFSTLTDSFSDDPTVQWTECRHLSRHQLCRVEQQFQDFWLPKLVVTLYWGTREQIDYRLVRTSICPERAQFQVERHSERVTAEVIKDLWEHDSLENRLAHVRLGEGLGLKGTYLISDIGLPELEVNGMTILFNWRKGFEKLMWEDHMLRKVGKSILDRKADQWQAENGQMKVPRNTYMKLLAVDVQMARRVAVIKHRMEKLGCEGQIRFHRTSQYLHGQPVDEPIPDGMEHCCGICSRKTGSDIFEVISQEESMVPFHPDFDQCDENELIDLYAEAFGWQCCRVQGRLEDTVFQQERANDWKQPSHSAYERIWTSSRWDILG